MNTRLGLAVARMACSSTSLAAYDPHLCGDHPILVGADTREGAEAAAVEREIETRRVHVPALPSCRRVLTVHPAGVVMLTGSHHSAGAEAEPRRP